MATAGKDTQCRIGMVATGGGQAWLSEDREEINPKAKSEVCDLFNHCALNLSSKVSLLYNHLFTAVQDKTHKAKDT